MARGCMPGYLDNRKENMLISSVRWHAGAYLEPGGVDVVAALYTRPGREGNSRYLWIDSVINPSTNLPPYTVFFNVYYTAPDPRIRTTRLQIQILLFSSESQNYRNQGFCKKIFACWWENPDPKNNKGFGSACYINLRIQGFGSGTLI